MLELQEELDSVKAELQLTTQELDDQAQDFDKLKESFAQSVEGKSDPEDLDHWVASVLEEMA